MDEMRFDACLSYQFSFSLQEAPGGAAAARIQWVLRQLRRRFPESIWEGDPAAAEDPVLRDLRTVQDFLHGGGLPFGCSRILVKGLELRFDRVPMEGTAVLLSLFPEFHTGLLTFSFRAMDVDTDQLIYLRQIAGGGARFSAQSGESGTLPELFRLVADALGTPVANVDSSYLLELQDVRPCRTVEALVREEGRRLYGMLCGDEGWEYVPGDLAAERLTNSWGSREFVRFITFGCNGLLLNLIRSPEAARYLERQEVYGTRAFGGMNPYFRIQSQVAGVNHGILISQEMVLVIKTIANRILGRQASRTVARGADLGKEIRKVKAFRSELITTINRVENIGISEMGELEQMLLRSYKITPLIDSIKYLLELLESELDLLYQQSTNRLVNILTVAGLLLSVMGVAIDMGWI